MNCLLCNNDLYHSITLKDFFSFQPYRADSVCKSCTSRFARIDSNSRCPGCGRSQEEQNLCADCKKWQLHYPAAFTQHEAMFRYDDALREWLHTYKIQGDIRYANVFRSQLRHYCQQNKKRTVIPLPISKKSLEERGFNQCEWLLEQAGIPYQQLLIHTQTGKKQSEKNRRERLAASQPFEVLPHTLGQDTPLLLFDDLYTTGRTMLYAKEALHEAGFKNILSFSIGR
ncbi:ComF family protein [Jeotgalibaca caeni]|uniref:ComF family protein n=1 Tax=Jeotgalibaca caeni TaxID=3028623 RepID=UPI00237D8AEA|nr:hypothetical protein [Jeotgalibaca caeni]MDE1550033.1 hypothetical protein [Jeotgalibaca caeni]